MKKTLFVLFGICLTGAGCIHALPKSGEFDKVTDQKVAMPRPPAVYSDQVNESNAWEKARALEAEMEYDAQNEPSTAPADLTKR